MALLAATDGENPARRRTSGRGIASSALLLSPPERVADPERQLLIRALERTTGNQTQAARLLRITRDTLRYKMKKYNLR